MATSGVYPLSEVWTLAAGVDRIAAGQNNGSITAQIKTGTTATLMVTCSPAADIDAGTADWVAWFNGSGPMKQTMTDHVTAIKLSSVAGGTVFLVRETNIR
jgi:hypothetical protein